MRNDNNIVKSLRPFMVTEPVNEVCDYLVLSGRKVESMVMNEFVKEEGAL